MGVSIAMGLPQNGGFIIENLIKMDDFGVPPFMQTTMIPSYHWCPEFFLSEGPTVHGCEILHHPKDGRQPLTSGKTIYQLVQDFFHRMFGYDITHCSMSVTIDMICFWQLWQHVIQKNGGCNLGMFGFIAYNRWWYKPYTRNLRRTQIPSLGEDSILKAISLEIQSWLDTLELQSFAINGKMLQTS